MDRLLRRYARRTGETLRATHDAGNDDARTMPESGSHLDADEMSAYAENALPEAARSRYFAHLADCETCRKLVTELALAATVSNEGKARVAALDIKPPTSWRTWLAAIFSPPALRYGVPALALFAVLAVVAIVAMRSQRESASVAQNKGEAGYSSRTIAPDAQTATANTTASGADENHTNSNVATFADKEGQAQPNVAATPTPPQNAPVEEDAPIVSQDRVAKPTTAQTNDAKDKAGEFGIAGKREQPEVAAATPPPPRESPILAGPAATEQQNRDKRGEPKNAAVAGKDDDELAINGRVAGGAISNNKQASEDRNGVGQVASTTTARAAQNPDRRRPSVAAKSAPTGAATEAERKETSPDTRSAGGRHFQRQGGAWVDTAYNSSRPTTNVRRGSEQYRALIADEPGLRSIVEQFSGELIVVWKSRAYRFH
jgi:hypothetical protein